MENIEFKAQIAELGVKCLERKIEFKFIRMTTRQVGLVAKLKRENKKERVKMTIEPVNKDLEIKPIVSPVFINNIGENDKGTYFKVSGFILPENQILDAVRYIDSKADIILVLEPLQEKIKTDSESDSMFDESEPGFDDNNSGGPADKFTDEPDPLDINLKIPPKWNSQCHIKIGKVGKNWKYGYIIKIGNVESSEPFDECIEYDDIGDCIYNLKQQINTFIDGQKNFNQSNALKKKIEKAIEDWIFEND